MKRRMFTFSILLFGIASNIPVLRSFFTSRVEGGWVLKDEDI